MPDLPVNRLNVEAHGCWVTLKDVFGVTHLAWTWNGGSSLGYLCCNDPELLESYEMPAPLLCITCMACIGTVV